MSEGDGPGRNGELAAKQALQNAADDLAERVLPLLSQ